MNRIVLLGLLFLGCIDKNSRKVVLLSGPIGIDSTWKVFQFSTSAQSEFYSNELQLVTAGRFDGIPDSNMLEVAIVSKGGQEYSLTDFASGYNKRENFIICSGEVLQTMNTGNQWTQVRIRSRKPMEILRIQWYSFNPEGVKF